MPDYLGDDMRKTRKDEKEEKEKEFQGKPPPRCKWHQEEHARFST